MSPLEGSQLLSQGLQPRAACTERRGSGITELPARRLRAGIRPPAERQGSRADILCTLQMGTLRLGELKWSHKEYLFDTDEGPKP